MKNNWRVEKLGNICEFINGKGHEKLIDENGYYIVVNSKFVSTEGKVFKKSKFQLLPLFKDDIVLVMSDVPNGKTLAKCFKIDEDDKYTLNQRVCSLRTHKIDIDFLFKQLNRNQYFLEFDNGENQTNLRKNDVLNCSILIPPLEEQHTIVAKLDQAFAAIDQAKANIEKNIANAKELFQSKLNQIFSQNDDWNWIELGKVCKTGAGGTPLKSKKEYYENGNIPWLLSGEVNNRNIIESKNFISKAGLENSSARLFPKDSVLIAMYGATAGQVGILRFESASNQAVCAIYPSDNFIADFLYYTFLYKKSELIGKAVGNAQPNISQIKIKETEIPLVKIELQKIIVNQLDQLQEQTKLLVSKYEQKINNLEELKKSILEKAFKGELS